MFCKIKMYTYVTFLKRRKFFSPRNFFKYKRCLPKNQCVTSTHMEINVSHLSRNVQSICLYEIIFLVVQ